MSRKTHLFFITFWLVTSTLSSLQGDISTQSTNSQRAIKKEIAIEKVMDYPIPQVIARYRKDYKISEEDAKNHERELKRFFILAAKYPEENFEMFSADVDNLWHTFLLFTKEYQKFCDEMFGTFIHHNPKVDTNQT